MCHKSCDLILIITRILLMEVSLTYKDMLVHFLTIPPVYTCGQEKVDVPHVK